jgi:hypothetical protein
MKDSIRLARHMTKVKYQYYRFDNSLEWNRVESPGEQKEYRNNWFISTSSDKKKKTNKHKKINA